jgi:uncharacterized membrane protein YfcA
MVLGLALGVLIGITLGFFGGGGSILTVPLLVYVFGLDAKQAIASSLLVVCAASASGALQYWRVGQIAPRIGLVFAAAGATGAYLGGRAGAFVDSSLLLLLFAAMMGLTATAMWRGRRAPAAPAASRVAVGRLLAQGLGVGIITGLIGAGGGFLIVPALALWAGLPMPTAVGTSLFVIVLSSLAGFAGYASHVAIDAALVGALMAVAIGGSFLGAGLARSMDPARLRRAFSGFVAAMALVIGAREADLWLVTVRAAVPATAPQLAFALAMLGMGIALGRVTRKTEADPFADGAVSQGGGI